MKQSQIYKRLMLSSSHIKSKNEFETADPQINNAIHKFTSLNNQYHIQSKCLDVLTDLQKQATPFKKNGSVNNFTLMTKLRHLQNNAILQNVEHQKQEIKRRKLAIVRKSKQKYHDSINNNQIQQNTQVQNKSKADIKGMLSKINETGKLSSRKNKIWQKNQFSLNNQQSYLDIYKKFVNNKDKDILFSESPEIKDQSESQASVNQQQPTQKHIHFLNKLKPHKTFFAYTKQRIKNKIDNSNLATQRKSQSLNQMSKSIGQNFYSKEYGQLAKSIKQNSQKQPGKYASVQGLMKKTLSKIYKKLSQQKDKRSITESIKNLKSSIQKDSKSSAIFQSANSKVIKGRVIKIINQEQPKSKNSRLRRANSISLKIKSYNSLNLKKSKIFK